MTTDRKKCTRNEATRACQILARAAASGVRRQASGADPRPSEKSARQRRGVASGERNGQNEDNADFEVYRSRSTLSFRARSDVGDATHLGSDPTLTLVSEGSSASADVLTFDDGQKNSIRSDAARHYGGRGTARERSGGAGAEGNDRRREKGGASHLERSATSPDAQRGTTESTPQDSTLRSGSGNSGRGPAPRTRSDRAPPASTARTDGGAEARAVRGRSLRGGEGRSG